MKHGKFTDFIKAYLSEEFQLPTYYSNLTARLKKWHTSA
jgi:hypothetical protein